MSKITLNSVADLTQSSTAQTTINTNSSTVQTAFDNTLSRDGTSPNQMGAALDMNSNQIINLPAPSTVNSPVRLVDVTGNPTITIPGTGTSGHVVPFLDGNNIWSGTNSFTQPTTLGAVTGTGNNTWSGTNTFSNTNTFSAANSFTGTVQGAIWGNTRSAKTTAYTVVNADKGLTLALGGSTFFVLTFSAASTYDSNFSVVVVNEDATRCKTISPNGLSSFYLFPLQTITIYNQNNVWQVAGKQKWVCPTSFTWNINHASGSDSITVTDGFGTGAAAFATITHAISVMQTQIDGAGSSQNIQLANETFTEAVNVRNLAPGQLQIFINGNPSTPGNVVWQCPGNSSCLDIRDFSVISLNGVTLQSTGSSSTGISCSQFAVCDISNIVFGTFTTGSGIQISTMGSVNYQSGTYSVIGNCGQHWFMQGCGSLVVASVNITVPNALTFTNWLSSSGVCFFQGNGLTFSGTGSAGGSTGTKYNLSLNSVALTSGAVLPGVTAGTTATGGQYS